MTEELTDIERAIQNSIGRHFVSLRCKNRTPGDAANSYGGVGIPLNFSAFVVDLGGDWFLITAGHVLENIAKARRAGMVIEDFRLDDAYRPDARFKHWDALIPFDFDNALKHFIDQSDIGDYAAIYLRQIYREPLAANKIAPFSPKEMGALGPDAQFDAYWLIGLPEDLMAVAGEGDETRQRSQLVVIRADTLPFDQLPDGVKLSIESKGIRKDNFFAQLPPADDLKSGEEAGLDSIVGVSGGPVIAWRRGSDGVLGYCLVAVQSSWWRPYRIIMACPITRYITALDRSIQADLAQEGARDFNSEPGTVWGNENRTKRIATRAYFHYENRTGREWNKPVSNWLQAEEEETNL